MGFDIDFVSADLFFKFLLKGVVFSVELTIVATLGGLALGTLLALLPLREFRVKASVADILPPEWESVKAWKSF